MFRCADWLKVSRPLTMKKEGIQTRNRKSSSKSSVVAAKPAADTTGSSAWSMREPTLPQPPSSSRQQPPYQFKAFASDAQRPSLSSYCLDAPPYHPDSDSIYPVAYAQQVPAGEYLSPIASFGAAASGFSACTAAGYCL